ncbi:replication initiation protein [Candidatus Babeliales bacterium]|nr:replication initiation protein [Candidatus Babeliales bacterium]MCF7899633.1 replication initiation protein [Candidatus Babeliales bacterium]
MLKYDIHFLKLILNISRKLSLVQQMTWNYLIFFSFNQLHEEEEHKISIARLNNYLKLNNNLRSNYIKDKLLKMTNNNNNNNNNNNFVYLTYYFSDIKITNNTIYYKYPLELLPIISNPCVLNVTKKLINTRFSSKFTLFLYEFCLYYQLMECIHLVPLDAIKNFMGISHNQYLSVNAFHKNIIIPALYEINQKTSLDVSIKYKKNGKTTLGLIFKIEEKDKEKLNSFLEEREKRFNFFLENIACSRYYKLSKIGQQKLDILFENWCIQNNFVFKNMVSKQLIKKDFLYKYCLAPYEKNIELWNDCTNSEKIKKQSKIINLKTNIDLDLVNI